MATWDELRKHLESAFEVGIDDGKLFGVDVHYGDGRKQRVFVATDEAYGKKFVQFRSLVAKADKISAAQAMAKNAEFALGHLIVEDQMYFLQYRLVLDDLVVEAVDFPVRTVATIADNLEAAHSGGKDMF